MTLSKTEVRQLVWDRMTEAGVARFPGAHGRIPNFEGAEAAARRLARLRVWRQARTLKANPDSPQRPVRERALREGKVVYMAVPRLRKLRCFVELDPARLRPDQLRQASTIKGAFRLGRLVAPGELRHIDLIVAGSVAVNRQGGRVGKGGGYSDLEYALGREFGAIGRDTSVVTTVHPMQVLEEPLPRLVHDIPVDIVVTPDEVTETRHQLPRPGGIYWDLLPEEKIAAIPVLRELRRPNR